MATSGNTYEQQANDLVRKLNGEDAAKVLAVLALAAAVDNLAAEIGHLGGNEANPFHVEVSG